MTESAPSPETVPETPPPRERVARSVQTIGRALLAAKVVAAVAFVIIITYGHGVLFRAETFGGFYDAQAKALLHGHFDVDPHALSLEGFVVGGRTYEYFGPVPAIMRMPWFALTDRGDGRLSALSMSLGYLLLLHCLSKLVWRALRTGCDPDSLDDAAARRVALLGGATLLTLACGPPLFLASRPWAYHEALTWGMAFMLWGLEALLRWRERPSAWRSVQVGVITTLCVLTRGTLGFGLVAAVASVVALEFLAPLTWPPIRRLSRWLARVDGPPRWRALGACVVLVPIALYAGVNQAKFGSLFGLPIETQVVSKFDPQRIHALEANGGSLFNANYIPSVLFEAIRPDGLSPRSVFPYVGFPRRGVSIIGTPVFDKLDVSTSLPASLPGPTLLAVIGVVAFVRRRCWREQLIVWTPLAGGASVAAMGVLTIGFIANRYLMDMFPVLLIAALAGLSVATDAVTCAPSRAEDRIFVRRGVVVVIAVLTAWSVWTGAALTLEYQRELSFGVADSERAAWVDLQARLGGLDGGAVEKVASKVRLPTRVIRNRVLVVGHCDVIYRGDADHWRSVWADAAGGHVAVRLARVELADAERIVVADDTRGTAVAVRRDRNKVWFEWSSDNGSWKVGDSASLTDVGRGVVSITIDPRIAFVGASLDDREVLSVNQGLDQAGEVQVRAGEPVTPDRSACRSLGY